MRAASFATERSGDMPAPDCAQDMVTTELEMEKTFVQGCDAEVSAPAATLLGCVNIACVLHIQMTQAVCLMLHAAMPCLVCTAVALAALACVATMFESCHGANTGPPSACDPGGAARCKEAAH